MPNWCNNKVKVFGEPEQLAQVAKIFKDEKSIFNNIIQSPDWKRLPNEKGQFPKLEQHKNPKTGEIMWETYNFPDGKNDDRWFHWNNTNWGTKWDITAKQVEIEYEDDEQLEVSFETAWAHPNQFVIDSVKCSRTCTSHGSMMNQQWNLQGIYRTLCKLSTRGCVATNPLL